MTPRTHSTDIWAWSANDPARPEVAWSASFGLMMRWPGSGAWHYGPWGPSTPHCGYHDDVNLSDQLPADAVLLVPDWLSAGRKRSSGVQR